MNLGLLLYGNQSLVKFPALGSNKLFGMYAHVHALNQKKTLKTAQCVGGGINIKHYQRK